MDRRDFFKAIPVTAAAISAPAEAKPPILTRDKQKFLRGDRVRINAPTTRVTDWHTPKPVGSKNHILGTKTLPIPQDEHGLEALISGSYHDLHGGTMAYQFSEYCVKWPKGSPRGLKVAWYGENDLILVSPRNIEQLDELDSLS